MDNFNLFGPPAILFFKDKNELKELRIVGYKNPEEFLSNLSK
jgi:thiol:disulfide interchange protein DsbD